MKQSKSMKASLVEKFSVTVDNHMDVNRGFCLGYLKGIRDS